MLYIAHRGNINGPNLEKENHPDYLKLSLSKGYHAEVDVWLINNKFILGHDVPQYEVDKKFLINSKFWCHAKNIEAISALSEQGYLIHSFFHDQDKCTLTSQGWIWTYPGQPVLCKRAIAVMPERASSDFDFSKSGGICSDFVENTKIHRIFK